MAKVKLRLPTFQVLVDVLDLVKDGQVEGSGGPQPQRLGDAAYLRRLPTLQLLRADDVLWITQPIEDLPAGKEA